MVAMARTRPTALAGGLGLLAACVLLNLPRQAQAQVFHLYLLCQGTVAAGLPSGAAAASAAASTSPLSRAARAQPEVENDKNSADINENVQARAAAVRSAGKRGNAYIDLALRDNNMTALVQRSNVLPVGERMKYVATQSHYAATYSPGPTSRANVDWRGSWFFSWHPPFQKMAATRVSVDRQSGVLEGEIVGPDGDILGLIDMQCEPRREGEGPRPRF
jgi:hypothetical protein